MSEDRPSHTSILHLHWPTFVLVVVAVVAWVDLRHRIANLEALRASEAPRVVAAGSSGSSDAGTDANVPLTVVDRLTTTEACSGSLTTEQVRDSVAGFGPTVFGCHGQHGQTNGLLALAVTVAADGRVQAVQAAGPVARDSAMMACVAEVMHEWRFPPPAGGQCAIVSLPFNLGVQVAPSKAPPPATP